MGTFTSKLEEFGTYQTKTPNLDLKSGEICSSHLQTQIKPFCVTSMELLNFDRIQKCSPLLIKHVLAEIFVEISILGENYRYQGNSKIFRKN